MAPSCASWLPTKTASSPSGPFTAAPLTIRHERLSKLGVDTCVRTIVRCVFVKLHDIPSFRMLQELVTLSVPVTGGSASDSDDELSGAEHACPSGALTLG